MILNWDIEEYNINSNNYIDLENSMLFYYTIVDPKNGNLFNCSVFHHLQHNLFFCVSKSVAYYWKHIIYLINLFHNNMILRVKNSRRKMSPHQNKACVLWILITALKIKNEKESFLLNLPELCSEIWSHIKVTLFFCPVNNRFLIAFTFKSKNFSFILMYFSLKFSGSFLLVWWCHFES